MNRYVLLILVSLQVNVSNSMDEVDKKIKHNEARKKQKLMDRLKRCHKYPEETIAVINEVEKKVHHYVGNNLDEEQRANIDKFKDICNEHIIELMNKIMIKNKPKNADIESMADQTIIDCMNAFGGTRGTLLEQWIPGGIAYLARGSLGDDVFKKMKEDLENQLKKTEQ